MKENKNLILILLLVLGVGFAAVTTTLYINGTVNIKADDTDFRTNVKFSNPGITTGTDASATISDDGKTLTFTTHALKTIGETSTITYKIANGSQYNARIGQVTCNPTGANASTASTYLTVTPTNGLQNSVVNHGTVASPTLSDQDSIVVTLTRSYTGSASSEATSENTTSFTYQCSLVATAEEVSSGA